MPHTCSIRMDGGIKVLVPDLEHHQTLKFARDNLVQWAKQMVQEQRVITPVRELDPGPAFLVSIGTFWMAYGTTPAACISGRRH